MRIKDHPILGPVKAQKKIKIKIDGKVISAFRGEPIATALLAAGIKVCRETPKQGEPRGPFCMIGQCTDCMMKVNGKPNVLTCITPAEEDMRVETQRGLGNWGESRD
jgi:predicted molibdopterin-dependent oxidoreductase YjgC